MWLNLNREDLNRKDHFVKLGKSLLLCQKFEFICLDIIKIMIATKSIFFKKHEPFGKDHKKYISYLKKLEKNFLGKAITDYIEQFAPFISIEEYEILFKAKEARNFICHEAARENSKYTALEFEEKIRQLALGDYLVSKWSYEFHEKQSGEFKNKDFYVDEVIAWVLQ